MNKICRLCMSVSSDVMYHLYEGCEILSKIWSCMSVQITLNNFLPNHVCFNCTNKINDVYQFHTQIKQNEEKLIHHLSFGNDSLQYVFEDIKSVTKIKDEKEDITDCTDYETISNDNVKNITDKDKSDPNYSSDDEITLSDLKQEKNVINITNTFNKVKRNKKTHLKHKTAKKTLKKTQQEFENIELNCLTCFQHFQTQALLIKHYYKEHLKGVNLETDKSIENANEYSQIDNGNPLTDDDSKRALNDNSKPDNDCSMIDSNSLEAVNDNIKNDHKYIKYKKSSKGGKITYECLVCMKQYEKKKDIDRHVISHKSDRPFLCKLCGRTYKTVYEIIRHGRAHSGIKLHCSQKCGFTTAYKGALKEHELRHEGLKYKYTCEKCGKGFQAKTWYDQHKNIHSGLKPFVCNLCGLAFHMDRYLTAHRSSVHPQTSKEKRHICVHCSTPCDSRNSLKRHMEEHGIKSTFLCDLCGKVFTNADVLKYHKNGHSGVKPHTCSLCKKTFAKKFNLKIHELTHTGERSHVCVKCGKYFTQRSTLLRHNRRHHPENQLNDVSLDENVRNKARKTSD